MGIVGCYSTPSRPCTRIIFKNARGIVAEIPFSAGVLGHLLGASMMFGIPRSGMSVILLCRSCKMLPFNLAWSWGTTFAATLLVSLATPLARSTERFSFSPGDYMKPFAQLPSLPTQVSGPHNPVCLQHTCGRRP